MSPDKLLLLISLNGLLPEEYRIKVTTETKIEELEYQLHLYRIAYLKKEDYLPDISNAFMNWRNRFQKIIDEDKT